MNEARVAEQEPIRIKLGSWDELGDEARRIRLEVFVTEQGVPLDMEIDAMDPVSVHALALRSAAGALGTGRLLPDGHIGRMAVARDARGQGVGAALLQRLMQAARQAGHRQVELFAQVHAQHFYEQFGFVAVGEPFDDCGILHITMRATL
ncbi:MAG TPA: GNAT family N-acetyltransferase [Burkholderiaceae bacterium]|nr:GNAT family N-acetyltransferase [Burkholderiaceae bacterium]